MPRISNDRATRALGVICLLGVAVFAIVCLAAQFLRSDYNPLGVPLSFYVLGPYGDMVQASFFVLAPGLAAVGVGGYLALDRRARSATPLLLFVLAGIALCVTAAELTDVPGHPPTLHGFIHVRAAAVTFFSVTIAMLLQSWRLRLDTHWRARFRSAFTLAAITFVALWIYALVRSIPRGLAEKVVIALILAWLWRAGWWLVRGPASNPRRFG
ncbi:MAG: DUF998 domain-containing protein [Rhodanobacteraceae bacterium]